MSANNITTALPAFVLKRKIIRYAFGILLVSAIAFGIDWPLSYLSILLVNLFLQGNRIRFVDGFNFLMKMIIAVVFSLFMSNYLLQYHIIYTVLIGLILFHIFYAKDSVISPVLKTWLLITLLLIPLMSLQNIFKGELIGWATIIATVVALVVVWTAFALFPDKESNSIDKQLPKPKVLPPPTPYERFIAALKRTAVVYPVAILFFYFEFRNSALILIYIGLYSSFPGFAKDFSLGKLLLAGCITGGIIAFFLYEIVVLVPLYSFLLMLFFGFALLAGNEMFGGGKYAAQVKAGFSAIIIVFGSAVSSNQVDAGGKVVVRVIQVAIVVFYLVAAFGIIEKLFPPKDSTSKKSIGANH